MSLYFWVSRNLPNGKMELVLLTHTSKLLVFTANDFSFFIYLFFFSHRNFYFLVKVYKIRTWCEKWLTRSVGTENEWIIRLYQKIRYRYRTTLDFTFMGFMIFLSKTCSIAYRVCVIKSINYLSPSIARYELLVSFFIAWAQLDSSICFWGWA